MHHKSSRRPDPPCLVLLSCRDILAPSFPSVPVVSGHSAVPLSPKHWRRLKSGLFCGRQCETAAGSGIPPAAGSRWTAWTTSSLSSLRGHRKKKNQQGRQINCGVPFNPQQTFAFFYLAEIKQREAKIWQWSSKNRMGFQTKVICIPWHIERGRVK